jgi:FAD/FMN-containing dehydrogenase
MLAVGAGQLPPPLDAPRRLNRKGHSATVQPMGSGSGAGTVEVWNWAHEIETHPRALETARSVEDVVRIVHDPGRYPSPVRAHGSNHSTSYCTEANGGTVVDVSRMDRILEIGPDYVRTEAGARLYDVAHELRRHNLQFYVNIELGNLTMGAAACSATKDASMPGEYGQVNSYCIGLKLVTPEGDVVEIAEDEPALLQAARSSYGLFGIVVEATFRVRPLQTMTVEHKLFSLDGFLDALPGLVDHERSIMMFLFPFTNRVIAELRTYTGPASPDADLRDRVWRFRNYCWKTFVPGTANTLTRAIPLRPVRYALVDGFNRSIQRTLALGVRDRTTTATNQIILYPDRAGYSKYTFSIWGFAEERYADTLREYFAWAPRYNRAHGFRCNMCHVGYRILKDESSLFSYTWRGNALTIDPVSTGGPGWIPFLRAYNEFCSQHDGSPLFNQTRELEPHQVRRAFGDRIERFEAIRKERDPEERFLNGYFRRLLQT